MLKKPFNKGWQFANITGTSALGALLGQGGPVYTPVTLPHDAMIHEKRQADAISGGQTGFHPGGQYRYTKTFDAPQDWTDKTVILEFEGVYCNSKVNVNGVYAGGYPYGYSNFYVDITNFVKPGESNTIAVEANNTAQPASRWYSGSGIYRPVNLYVGNPVRVKLDSLRINPREITEDSAIIDVTSTIVNDSLNAHTLTIQTVLTDADGYAVACDNNPVVIFRKSEETVHQRIFLDTPHLWDLDDPYLYTATVRVLDGAATTEAPAADELASTVLSDEASDTFGIRTITVDPKHGFCLNGKQVLLAGTCIHHDNGIIGAATLQAAENKRCREMKAAGFNAIRSAHHPMSKEMLRACDSTGMLVMDELSDIWTQEKNANDYSALFPRFWKEDVKKMVDKDYNHPCVIFYSTGNEILEAGTTQGANLNRHIANLFRDLDPSRYTTAACNGMLAAMDAIPIIIGDMMKKRGIDPAAMAAQASGDSAEDGGGVGGMNAAMSIIMSGDGADEFASHPIMTKRTAEYANATDLLGYNYLTQRHIMEHDLNPNHVVIGTETYPAEIYHLWDVMKKHPWAIGDFTWTGYDYLGEAGCGIFYYDGKQNFGSWFPDIAAYIGDINLIGYRRPISYYREIVFGKRKAPYLAVLRMDKDASKASKTQWMWKDNVASWTWPGYEGKQASVDVYSVSSEVELFLNGRSLGTKPAGDAHEYVAAFEVPYEPGELKVIGRTAGAVDGEFTLKTADMDVRLDLSADRCEIKACPQDAAFVTARLTDACGTENLFAQKDISVSIEGPAVIEGFGSANPSPDPDLNYQLTTWPSYDGEVMACIRPTGEAGTIRVTFSADGCEDAAVEIAAK